VAAEEEWHLDRNDKMTRYDRNFCAGFYGIWMGRRGCGARSCSWSWVAATDAVSGGGGCIGSAQSSLPKKLQRCTRVYGAR